MRLRPLLVSLLVGLAVFPAVAGGRPARGHAASSAQWGISDDAPSLFEDPRFAWLKVRTARIVMAWNVMYRPAELQWRNEWLAAARAAGVKPLVAFSADPAKPRWLPTLAQYDRAVSRFVKSHPWVREYTVWDEENHYTQPTSHDPGRAAQYFNLLARMCRSCKVVAADVLDEPNMAGWIRRFLPDAHGARIWGIHNYIDLNDGTDKGTLEMLRLVKGEVWFTETGGLVWRYEHFGHRYIVRGTAYAARAASRLHALAALNGRVRRIYYYQWRVPLTLRQAERRRTVTWDSGLIAPGCGLRPAFDVVARVLGHNPARAPRAWRDRAGACVALRAARRGG
jgi:polysaccharide biosynthesis protein PslG